mgnify:CR=1 FL=1
MMPFKFPLPGEKALVMGIINLSPDSFYGASRCKTVEQALSAAERMLEEGADILDRGAESSRPGSVPLTVQEELDHLLHGLIKLVEMSNILIFVDKYLAL